MKNKNPGLIGKVLFLILFLGASIQPLFSMASQEDRQMAEARQLIEDRELDEAIRIMQVVAASNPERLDEVESLLAVIRRLRREYNAMFGQLISNLYEEKNFERALEQIRILESMDRSPNRVAEDLLVRSRRAATLQVSIQRFQSIMSRGKEFLDQEQYAQAIETYFEGFTLHKDEFDEEEFDALFRNTIESSLENLLARSRQLIAQESVLKESQVLGAQLIANSPPGTINQEFTTLFNRLDEMAQWRREIDGAAKVFQEQNDILQDNRGFSEYFLDYAILVTRGRSLVDFPEGILGSFDLFWERILDSWESDLRSKVTGLWNQALVAWPEGEYAQAQVRFQEILDLADLGQRITGLWRSYLDWEENFRLSRRSWDIIKNRLGPFKEWQTLGELVRVLRDVSTLTAELENLDLALLDNQQLLVNQEIWRENQGEMELFLSNVESQREGSFILEDYGISLRDLDDWTIAASEIVQNALQLSRRTQISLRRELARRELQPLEENFFQREENLEQIIALEEGELVTEGAFEEEERRFFPDQVLALGEAELPLWESLIASLTDYTQGLSQEEQFILQDPEIQGLRARSASLLGQSQSLFSQFSLIFERAQVQVAQARELFIEATSLLNKIEQDTSRPGFSNFDQSLRELDQGVSLFSQYLAIQWDQEAKEEFDPEVLRLSRIIAEGRQRIVQEEVRVAATQARSFYNRGLFRESLDLINQATRRWSEVFGDIQNPTLFNLFILVSRALNASSGRTVAPTDPLFGEVQQLLRLAESFFLRARNAGNEQEKERMLLRAEENLSKIRQLFPLNQKASLLGLRILQQTLSPQEYEEVFASRFEDAQSGIANEPVEALSILEDLETLRPDYPGLQGAITRAKIAAGIIAPPVTQAEIGRSRALTNQARTILQNFTEPEQLNQVLALTTQAIGIWDNNVEAQALFNQAADLVVSIQVGTLSVEDDRIYQNAVVLQQQGRYTDALRLVDRLWSNPQNRGVQKLRDLRERLAVILQI